MEYPFPDYFYYTSIDNSTADMMLTQILSVPKECSLNTTDYMLSDTAVGYYVTGDDRCSFMFPSELLLQIWLTSSS